MRKKLVDIFVKAAKAAISTSRVKEATASQFPKFFVTGILNTAVDFGVLNVLIFLFGLGGSSLRYAIFKTVSFLAAVCNSYLFNKFWVFARPDRAGLAGQPGRPARGVASESFLFFLVSVCGFLINVAASSLTFRIVLKTFTQNQSVASNFGALVGVVFVFIFNFFGYKFLVFK